MQSGVVGLIEGLERWRDGNLTIDGQDFEGAGLGSRFYPLLYLLTRVQGARDFGRGLPLRSHLLGHLTSLQIHHIFPKAVLNAAWYGRSQAAAGSGQSGHTRARPGGGGPAAARGDRVRGLHVA